MAAAADMSLAGRLCATVSTTSLALVGAAAIASSLLSKPHAEKDSGGNVLVSRRCNAIAAARNEPSSAADGRPRGFAPASPRWRGEPAALPLLAGAARRAVTAAAVAPARLPAAESLCSLCLFPARSDKASGRGERARPAASAPRGSTCSASRRDASRCGARARGDAPRLIWGRTSRLVDPIVTERTRRDSMAEANDRCNEFARETLGCSVAATPSETWQSRGANRATLS